MSDKKDVPFIDPRKAVCKWDACAGAAQVRGFCRLHFLKSLKLKKSEEEVELEKEAIARMRKERRRGNRLVSLEDSEEGDQQIDVQARVSSIDNIDLDIENGLVGDEFSKPRKTGTDD